MLLKVSVCQCLQPEHFDVKSIRPFYILNCCFIIYYILYIYYDKPLCSILIEVYRMTANLRQPQSIYAPVRGIQKAR